MTYPSTYRRSRKRPLKFVVGCFCLPIAGAKSIVQRHQLHDFPSDTLSHIHHNRGTPRVPYIVAPSITAADELNYFRSYSATCAKSRIQDTGSEEHF